MLWQWYCEQLKDMQPFANVPGQSLEDILLLKIFKYAIRFWGCG